MKTLHQENTPSTQVAGPVSPNNAGFRPSSDGREVLLASWRGAELAVAEKARLMADRERQEREAAEQRAAAAKAAEKVRFSHD